jgi:2-alkenal reductase
LAAVLLVALLLFGLLTLTSWARGGRAELASTQPVLAPVQGNLAVVGPVASRPLVPAPAVESAIGSEGLALVAAYEEVLSGIYQSVLPSVVHIQVSQRSNGLPFDHPELPDTPFQQGEGSGFVWDREGHIVTNYHVVEDVDSVTVVFSDGTTVQGEVLGGDPNVDLAVVQIDGLTDQLVPVQLGDSEGLRVGQMAVAIGNPFGLENTMTYGIISALGRTIASGTSQYSIPEVIQTDAPINPGNSGGPLLDREGRVIGINTQIVSRSGSSAGIGFAVPVNIAKRLVPALH